MRAQAGIIGGIILILIMIGAVSLIYQYESQTQRGLIQGLKTVEEKSSEPILYIIHQGDWTQVYSDGKDEITYVIYPNGTERKVDLWVNSYPINISYLIPHGWAVLVTSYGLTYNVSSYDPHAQLSSSYLPLAWPVNGEGYFDSNGSVEIEVAFFGGTEGLTVHSYTYSLIFTTFGPIENAYVSNGYSSLPLNVRAGNITYVTLYLPSGLISPSYNGGSATLDFQVSYGGEQFFITLAVPVS